MYIQLQRADLHWYSFILGVFGSVDQDRRENRWQELSPTHPFQSHSPAYWHHHQSQVNKINTAQRVFKKEKYKKKTVLLLLALEKVKWLVYTCDKYINVWVLTGLLVSCLLIDKMDVNQCNSVESISVHFICTVPIHNKSNLKTQNTSSLQSNYGESNSAWLYSN